MKRAFSILGLAILLLATSQAQACPGHHYAAREKVQQRSCWANQRVLAGALEMRSLDKNEKLPETFQRLTLKDQEALVQEGYIKAAMADPGTRPEVFDNYVLLPPKAQVACVVHGICGGSGPAREQWAAAGVQDPKVLALAMDRLPPVPPPPFLTEELILFTVLFFLIEAGTRLLGRRRDGKFSLWRPVAWSSRLFLLLGVVPMLLPRPEYRAFDAAFAWMGLIASLVLVGGAWRGVCALTRRLVPPIQLKADEA